jgi:putative transposase
LSLAAKRGAVEPGHPQLSIARQCALLGLSRASYYRGEPLVQDPADTLRLMRLIDEE